MSRITFEQLKAIVQSYVVASKLSNATYSETKDNLVGLLDKIGKIAHVEQSLQSDKLAMFDGEYLSFGKDIEEWEQDLYPVSDFDATGAGALTPDFPSYRPVFYSKTLGRKKIKVSIKYDDVERAVNNEGQFTEIVSTQYKRIDDSFIQWRYAVKREMLADLIGLAEGFMNGTATEYQGVFDPTGDYDIGDVVANASPATAYYIVFKAYDNDEATLAEAIASGYLVQLDLVASLAQPTDTSTGEAFIEQLKKDVEIAQDSSQGHSLNGNALGVQETMVLIIKQGILPNLDVNTLAGAFHLDKVAIPTEVVVVKDFGSDTSGAYAVLMDRRGMRLHPTYNATRENLNGDGDFLNVFRHTENTAYLSRNTFLKVYKNPA